MSRAEEYLEATGRDIDEAALPSLEAVLSRAHTSEEEGSTRYESARSRGYVEGTPVYAPSTKHHRREYGDDSPDAGSWPLVEMFDPILEALLVALIDGRVGVEIRDLHLVGSRLVRAAQNDGGEWVPGAGGTDATSSDIITGWSIAFGRETVDLPSHVGPTFYSGWDWEDAERVGLRFARIGLV